MRERERDCKKVSDRARGAFRETNNLELEKKVIEYEVAFDV